MKVWVTRDNVPNVEADLTLDTSSNLFTGEKSFIEEFGNPTTLEADLLLIGSSIFAADRACERGEREDYQRRIEISVPVVNVSRLVPMKPQLERILRILSNDAWRIELRQAPGVTEEDMFLPQSIGQVLLFSGGLDSVAAAVALWEQHGQLELVSHVTRNQHTSRAQTSLVEVLRSNGIEFPHRQFFVSSRSSEQAEHDVEDSQRTRSFLFLTLAALVARRTQHYEIVYLAENGQMAIHLPLTSGRIGAFSTHTAHPEFLRTMEGFLAHVLNAPISITNPFLYRTKAEVIQTLVTKVPKLVDISQSCWRNARLPPGVTHCGECIPCFIRRIAIEFHVSADPTTYKSDPWKKDVLSLPSDDLARRNLVDLIEFILKIEKSSAEEIMSEWPELYSRYFDAYEVIDMYKRFAREARIVLVRYPSMKRLLN